MEFIRPKMTRKRSSENMRRSSSLPKMGFGTGSAFKSPISANIPRKRKRKDTSDTASLSELDLNAKDSKRFRRHSLSRVGSIANLFSPVAPVSKKVTSVLKKSLSLRNLVSPSTPTKYSVNPYKPPQPSPTKRRPSIFWSDSLTEDHKQNFTHTQIERQEAIFELYRCEEDLQEDLRMVKQTYYDSLQKLQLMTEDELNQIFGQIDKLMPLHEDLITQLREQRLPDGTTQNVGQVLVNWTPSLEVYVPYCANQVYARALLDKKKRDPSVEDFLERCQESPFSRKLDLWSFLDVPRSTLVKYPLLFKSIQKLTPSDHEDVKLIDKAIEIVEGIIAQVDKKTGEARCKYIRDLLDYLDDKQRHPAIADSKVLLCEGVVRNNRGTKLQGFLFDQIMVLSRPATRGDVLRYQVYRQPIPMSELVVEDLQDGPLKTGSFKSAFGQGQIAKNAFRISFTDPKSGQSHTLQANSEHDKRQWMQCIQSVLPPGVRQTQV